MIKLKINFNQAKNFFVLSLIVFIVSGCARIKTTTTVYHTNDFIYQGKTYNYLPLKGQGNLQYDYVTSLVDNQLIRYGLIKNDKFPDYIVTMAYGISNPQVSTVNKPIWGQTGVSSSYTTSSYSYDAFGDSIYGTSNTTYTPTYGIVGSVPATIINYMRYFSLYIYQTKELSLNNIKPVYTMDVRSFGESGNLDQILPSVIYGGFSNFPGNSGGIYENNVNVNSKIMNSH